MPAERHSVQVGGLELLFEQPVVDELGLVRFVDVDALPAVRPVDRRQVVLPDELEVVFVVLVHLVARGQSDHEPEIVTEHGRALLVASDAAVLPVPSLDRTVPRRTGTGLVSL